MAEGASLAADPTGGASVTRKALVDGLRRMLELVSRSENRRLTDAQFAEGRPLRVAVVVVGSRV